MIINILKYIIRLRFIKIEEKDLLIFDLNGSDLIKQLYLNSSYNEFDSRLNRIDVLSALRALTWFGVNKNLAYTLCYIKRTKAKKIVTYTDNNINFYLINQYFPDIETIAFQNGTRTISGDIFSNDKLGLKLSATDIYVHNKNIGSYYKKFINTQIHSHGSLRSNLALKYRGEKNGEILFLSQYICIRKLIHIRDIRGKDVYDYEYLEVHGRVFKLIESICKKNNLKLKIQLREREGNPAEIEYFNRISKFNNHSFSCESQYRSIDAASMVISVDSTLGYESLGRGNKTLVLSVRGRDLNLAGYNFGWPAKFDEVGPFWTNIYDELLIEKIFKNIHQLSQDAWNKISKNYIDEIMVFNSEAANLNFENKTIS